MFTVVDAIEHGLHKIGYISLRPDAEEPALVMPKYKGVKTKRLMWAVSRGGQVMFLSRQYGAELWFEHKGKVPKGFVHPGKTVIKCGIKLLFDGLRGPVADSEQYYDGLTALIAGAIGNGEEVAIYCCHLDETRPVHINILVDAIQNSHKFPWLMSHKVNEEDVAADKAHRKAIAEEERIERLEHDAFIEGLALNNQTTWELLLRLFGVRS